MSEQKDFGLIYKRLLSHCPPYSHGEPWQELPAPDDIGRLPANPDPMISDLRQEFSDAQLLEAGVIVMDETMAIQPNTMLCEADGLVIALRNAPEDNPYEVFTNQGTLSGRMLPVCASLRDSRVRKMIQATKENVLFATTTTVELAVFTSLQIPATLNTGLANLGGDYLQQVQEDFQLNPPKPKYGIFDGDDEEEKKEKAPDLLLVGCRLADLSLEKPEGLAKIASHLAGVEEHLDVPLDSFYMWRPSIEEMKRFEFCITHAGFQRARAAILASVESSTVQLIVHRRTDESPKNLAEALEKLRSLRSRPKRDSEDERRAWEQIQRLIQTESVAPLQEAAADIVDPIEREFWRLAAMNGQILYPQFTRLILKSNTEPKNTSPGGLIAFPDMALRQVMQLMERQQKFLKNIADYQKNPFRRWK